MAKKEVMSSRKSARISAMQEKARMLAIQKQTKYKATCSSDAGISSSSTPTAKKRGRKCKSLQAFVTNSVITSPYQEGEEPKPEDNATKAEQMENLTSLQRMPDKQTLEFVLDLLQRRDTQEIFAQPVDPKEVVGYYSIIREPMDFGTMRAKLQEGMYSSLEQFEYDVSLISSNAMRFNSPTTVYYTEARAISELARRLFQTLRTEPENLKLEFSRTRRRPGRKPQSEAGGSHSRSTKPASSKDGVSFCNPSSKRSTVSLPQFKPYIGQKSTGIVPVSTGGKVLNCPETDRRMTYKSQNSFYSKNEKLVSTVYNAPKPLTHVSNAGSQYAESLMKFVSDLGPAAQIAANKKVGKCPVEGPSILPWTPTSAAQISANKKVGKCPVEGPSILPWTPTSAAQIAANKKVGKCPVEGPHILPWTPTSAAQIAASKKEGKCPVEGPRILPWTPTSHFRKTADFRLPSPALQNHYRNQGNGGQMPYNIISSPPDSYKGKVVCTDGGMNISGRGLISHNNLSGARPQTNNGGLNDYNLVGGQQTNNSRLTDYNLVGGQGPKKSGSTDACGSSKSNDNMDLLLATLMQTSAIQNQTHHTPSGTYFPFTGYADLLPAPSSQINNGSQSWLLPNQSQPTSLPYQTSILASANKAIPTSSSGFPNVEGPSTTASAVAVDQNKLMEWKQPAASWGLPTICDLPDLETQGNEQVFPIQNVLLQQQVASTQEQPNAPNFVGGARTQDHQAESSAQVFWNALRSSLMGNNKQPDLDLQL